MRGWWQDLTDLVLPAECGGCGRPRAVLCPECRGVLGGAVPRRVRPVPEPPGLPVVHAAARYADEVRAALLAHKERGALALAAPLGAALAGAVRAGLQEARGRAERGDVAEGTGMRMDGRERRAWGRDGAAWGGTRGGHGRLHGHMPDHAHRRGRMDAAGGTVLLVPVPSARRAVRARGHDPARRIALAAAGELRRSGTPARVLAVLRQGRHVADQAGLNSWQRLENLAGALEVAPGAGRLLHEGPVVLVDDLMTTGASLAEAARAVRAGMAEGAEREADRGGAGRGRRVGGRGGTAVSRAAFARGVSVGAGEREEVARAVYSAVSRESTGERMTVVTEEETAAVPPRPGMMGVGSAHDVICAAVVAASPDSFEINRN
ncbi:ComF family protein [Streptomyces sp. NPDC001658]